MNGLVILGYVVLIVFLVALALDRRALRQSVATLRDDVEKSDAWVEKHRHILDAHRPDVRHSDQDVANLFARTRAAMHAHWRRDEPPRPKKPEQSEDLVFDDSDRLVMDAPENAAYIAEVAEYTKAMEAYGVVAQAWTDRVEAEKAAFLPYDDAVTNTFIAWAAERPAPEPEPEPELDPAVTEQAMAMVNAQLAGKDYHVVAPVTSAPA